MADPIDILVAGGGPAGLITTLLLAETGWRVACVDPGNPGAEKSNRDLRSTAFLAPSVATLESAGLFESLRPHAAALRTMRILETGTDGAFQNRVDFEATETGLPEFGFNIANDALRRTLADAIAAHPNAELRPGLRVTGLLARDHEAHVRLSDGTSLRPALVVAADGRASPLRDMAGIPANQTSFGQKSLSFAVSHTLPHDNISTEIYCKGGPFTIIPLPGDDQTRSAIVWMDEGPEAVRRMALDETAFAAEATSRSVHLVGDMTLISDRALWPVASTVASRLTGDRLALLGEAAHALPPIGAQGLNLSLRDAETLRDLVRAAPDRTSLGAPALLDRYERTRLPDIRARAVAVDGLNRAARAGSGVLKALRRAGIRTFEAAPPLRQAAMRFGLGART